jgi:trehalose-phosphatase
VTGRPSDVAREIVGVDGITYVGEHGLELSPDAEEWAARLSAFAAGTPWPELEEKRRSLAFHYRNEPDPEEARERLEPIATAALDAGLKTRWGRMVLEVLPPLEVTKGTAVKLLLEEHDLQRALYAGDDTTDLDGFRALDGLECAVRVAVVSTEGPSQLGSSADLVVGSPEAFRELLAQL